VRKCKSTRIGSEISCFMLHNLNSASQSKRCHWEKWTIPTNEKSLNAYQNSASQTVARTLLIKLVLDNWNYATQIDVWWQIMQNMSNLPMFNVILMVQSGPTVLLYLDLFSKFLSRVSFQVQNKLLYWGTSKCKEVLVHWLKKKKVSLTLNVCVMLFYISIALVTFLHNGRSRNNRCLHF
jgi:hypothetical protein